MQQQLQVHGGIRHLEKKRAEVSGPVEVHGGIRHLEIKNVNKLMAGLVHGGIRHLETLVAIDLLS